MQFKRKLINQAWENAEKPNFGSDFGPFDPRQIPQNVPNQKKLKIQSWKKLSDG